MEFSVPLTFTSLETLPARRGALTPSNLLGGDRTVGGSTTSLGSALGGVLGGVGAKSGGTEEFSEATE